MKEKEVIEVTVGQIEGVFANTKKIEEATVLLVMDDYKKKDLFEAISNYNSSQMEDAVKIILEEGCKVFLEIFKYYMIEGDKPVKEAVHAIINGDNK